MKRSMKILWLTTKAVGVVGAVAVFVTGVATVRFFAPMVVEHYTDKIAKSYDRIVNGPSVIVQQVEPEYCDGVCGLLTKHAKVEAVPVAVAKAVAMQEGGQHISNMQVNCQNRYWAKERTLKNCALGMMQLIPAFNDIDDPLSILGPDNLERNIQLGVKRLKQDFNASKGATVQARWYNAFIRYYGADQDGYPAKVMALVTKFAVEEG